MLLKIRGKESTTLTFVTISWLVLLVNFMLSGTKIGDGTHQIITAQEFGIAFGIILAVWLGREINEKKT